MSSTRSAVHGHTKVTTRFPTDPKTKRPAGTNRRLAEPQPTNRTDTMSIHTVPVNDNAVSLTAARHYVATGLSVIPVRLDGSKTPAFAGWREYADRQPTDSELRRWFSGPTRHG